MHTHEIKGVDVRGVRKQVFKGTITQMSEEVRFSIGKLMAQ